jgi:hypothetical protein
MQYIHPPLHANIPVCNPSLDLSISQSQKSRHALCHFGCIFGYVTIIPFDMYELLPWCYATPVRLAHSNLVMLTSSTNRGNAVDEIDQISICLLQHVAYRALSLSLSLSVSVCVCVCVCVCSCS